jgi:hypothetical protein
MKSTIIIVRTIYDTVIAQEIKQVSQISVTGEGK